MLHAVRGHCGLVQVPLLDQGERVDRPAVGGLGQELREGRDELFRRRVIAEHEFARIYPLLALRQRLDGKLEIPVAERFRQESVYGPPLSVDLRELVTEGYYKGRRSPVHDYIPAHIV